MIWHVKSLDGVMQLKGVCVQFQVEIGSEVMFDEGSEVFYLSLIHI